ncbi:hydrogenase formation protein HypD (plasmid) [Acaryochloris sp. 'Moss Beach']|uniref:hydrogenase formation protein HypD n=1 Tax=Acaryochloris TaxID=155977 RepID=UPI001BAF8934|nr:MULTISPECIES: hydrogenase formation protein HypD [Acaryochloris]QUY46103.1 hydrogenase formation protein HypD [Acaryochloris marina S15]UJB72569.1 hydrogenase formation protein HypD [Acaryochloris sp. 'Moss Beach']
MKFVDEYRDPGLVKSWVREIDHLVTRPWTIMEICGGQTHTIVKHGIDQLLPRAITLVHGPGCPVCVTPVALINDAITLAKTPGVMLCSFGDMLRVPGTKGDLLSAKAQGGVVRMVYSSLDALKLAQANPDQQIVFFAVGFETTVPATAMAVYQAHRQGISNFSVLVAHVLVPPAMKAILSAPDCSVQGFLAAGHVCMVMGYATYEEIATQYHTPIVVTGFEPVDILQGIYHCLQQLEVGKAVVENQYPRVVQSKGNSEAQQLMAEVFEPSDRQWRGLTTIPNSGLKLRPQYAYRDAQALLPQNSSVSVCVDTKSEINCISDQILQGFLKPPDCPAFGHQCTPEHPLGAPMVSSEGACAAYYRYRQFRGEVS